MSEPETIEKHGYEGRKVEFNQNEQEGVYVGGSSTSGNCPSLDLALTEHIVYVISKRDGNIVEQADIKFEYQWVDEDGNEVDDDDPTGVRGKPTEPKDGAVEAAIEEARHKSSGFMCGWSTRHEKGPQYSNIQKYAHEFTELDHVIEIPKIIKSKNEFEAVIEIPNNLWGLPSEIYNWIDDYPTLEMVDISHVTEEQITIFIDRDTSRTSKY